MAADLLWSQCAHWLCEVGVLPKNHRIFSAEAEATILAYTLRDGVLLCHLANALIPGCIDNRAINQRPQLAQFLCLKNIRLFLKACSDTFGITKESDRFEPSMLYDFTDFARVLHTLSKLSQSPKARLARPQVAPFPNTNHHNSFVNDVYDGGPSEGFDDEDDNEEEHIYRRLEDMVSEDHYREFCYQGSANGGQRTHYYLSEDHEEEVYADLCLYRRRGGAAGSGSDAGGQTQQELRNELLANFQPKEKRDYCIRELIETEGNYVDALNMLRKNFIRPMVAIKDTDKKIIFMNIKDLGKVHAAFYTSLLESVSGKSTARRIGEIFVEFKEKFLMYGEYCSSLQLAQETLDSLCAKDPAVAHEVTSCEKLTDNGRFRLRDLLAVPMQRILKYHLLLRELLNRTAVTHPEHRSIQQAYEAMIDVSEFINEVKRDTESIAIIRETQASITDWNMPQGVELKDYGRLRRDGELRIHSHENVGGGVGGKNSKSRYIFVFDKVMLVCKSNRDHYSFKESLKLSDYRVEDLSPSTAASTPSSTTSLLSTQSFLAAAANGGGTLGRRVMRRESSRWTHSFVLVHVQNTHAYTLYARTPEDKDKWIEAIREALDNVAPRCRTSSPHDIYMATFSSPTTCDSCRKLLKGIFYQGYKCHSCNRSMHKDCIQMLHTCGKSSIPPALPPRPTSMQLPTPISLNRISSFSVDESTVSVTRDNNNTFSQTNKSEIPQVPKFPLLSQGSVSSLGSLQLLQNGSNPDYINTKLEEHSWFVGEMDRDMANRVLAPYPIYTFLVRCRVVNGERVGFALSLKTDPDVKHMKIDSMPTSSNMSLDMEFEDDSKSFFPSEFVYFLSETRKFRSVVELVTFYSRNSLKESFSGLDTSLRFPINDISFVKVAYSYTPTPDQKNILTLKEGDQLSIIDKSADNLGWWKAFDGRKIGYIPKDFVTAIEVSRP